MARKLTGQRPTRPAPGEITPGVREESRHRAFMGKWARTAIGLGSLKIREVKALVESGRAELGIRDDSRCPIHFDAPRLTETVSQFMDPITVEYERQTNQATEDIRRTVTDTEDIANIANERAVSRNVAANVAADATIPNLAAPFLIQKEQGIPGSVVRRWIDRNIGLIQLTGKGRIAPIPREHFKEMRRILDLGIRRNTNHVSIARQLRNLDGITARRARTIAIDQINKHNGAMTRTRHQQMNFKFYFWTTEGDGKVRPEHQAREGVEFAYAQPPPDGNPGEPVRCRCWANPNIRRSLGLEFEPPQTGFRVTGDPQQNAVSLARGKLENVGRTLRGANKSVKEARRVFAAAPQGTKTAARAALSRAEGFRSKAERSVGRAEKALAKLG